MAALLCAAVAHSATGIGGPGAADFLGKWAYNAVLAGSAVAVIVRGCLLRSERTAWLLLGASLMIWTIGNTYYSIVLWNMDPIPIPSFSDVCWLGLYPGSYVALILLAKSRVVRSGSTLWLDGLIGALTVGALGAAVLFEAVLKSSGGDALAVATNLAYHLSDLLLLAIVVGVVGLTGWRTRKSWALIAAGIGVFAIIDGIYLYQSSAGAWVPGSVLEAGWPLAMLLLAFAAWQPPTNRLRVAEEGWRVFTAPVVLALTGLAVLVYDHFAKVNSLAIILASTSLVAVIARMSMTFGENLRMIRSSRREAMTDALTGLGNRRSLINDLEATLASATSSTSTLMIVLDLDGFKSYNDAFGHPAGDALLARLGRRFTNALSGRGTGYRMGGDEFCALVKVGPEGVEPVVASTVASLSESGEGFSIHASHGHILIPDESDDPTEALRIADQRLYVCKNGGRLSIGRYSTDLLLRMLGERSPELASHLTDVARHAEAVGRKLQLDPEEVEQVRLAAELHDVGKVGIPDEILNKPGRLEDDEWAFIQRHTIIGERILNASPALVTVAKLVRSSHEDFDGSGYPDGLVGQDIPLGSRIGAVCDAYDAMTQDRPYRVKITSEEALAELRRCAGSQFDPVVVEAFSSTLAEAKEALSGVRVLASPVAPVPSIPSFGQELEELDVGYAKIFPPRHS